MGDDGATYFSHLDYGAPEYEEDVNTSDSPTPFRPGYGENVGSSNEIKILIFY